MATANKFNAFVQSLANGAMNLGADSLKVMLSNTAPIATNSLYGDISANELANGNGYTTGGAAVTTVSSTQSSGTLTLTLTNVTFTASGSMGPFRYVVLYDTTPTSPLKPLILWWDYGSSITLNSGDTFSVAWNGGGSTGSALTLA